MPSDPLLSWFSQEVVPAILEVHGRTFADGSSAIRGLDTCQFEDLPQGEHNFASSPSFVQLRLKKIDGTSCSRHFVVKFQVQDATFREKMKTVTQFENESCFYNRVVKECEEFLEGRNRKGNFRTSPLDVLPKCYYAHQSKDDPGKGIVVLEDLRESGYRLSRSNVELDHVHCNVAVETLARFHALSYAMKYLRWPGFDELKTCWKTVWLSDDDLTKRQCNEFKKICAQRGLDFLSRDPGSEVPHGYLERIRGKLEDTYGLLKEANSPEEPLAVICHGDFNRNNILFAYSDDGTPERAKLLDFQTFAYGSPCLDLSFFIYMNTTLETRQGHLNKVFEHYYSTLIRTTSAIARASEDDIAAWIPFSSFQKDFERVCLNAYVTVSFFLPVMMAPLGVEALEMMRTAAPREMADHNYRQGGQPVSKRIAEVVVDFYRRRFFCDQDQGQGMGPSQGWPHPCTTP